jgi:hypothetical protein
VDVSGKQKQDPRTDDVFAEIMREILSDEQPRDPGGEMAADVLIPEAYMQELDQREVEGYFEPPYSRAILYAKFFTDGRPAVCDLVGDNGEGEPPELGQIPANRFLRQGIPYRAPDFGDTVAGVLRRWALPPEVVVVIIEQAEVEGPRRTRQVR